MQKFGNLIVLLNLSEAAILKYPIRIKLRNYENTREYFFKLFSGKQPPSRMWVGKTSYLYTNIETLKEPLWKRLLVLPIVKQHFY